MGVTATQPWMSSVCGCPMAAWLWRCHGMAPCHTHTQLSVPCFAVGLQLGETKAWQILHWKFSSLTHLHLEWFWDHIFKEQNQKRMFQALLEHNLRRFEEPCGTAGGPRVPLHGGQHQRNAAGSLETLHQPWQCQSGAQALAVGSWLSQWSGSLTMTMEHNSLPYFLR